VRAKPRFIALTGTPGVGKTRVATALRKRGFEVVDGNEFARDSKALVGRDRRRKSSIVDLGRIGRALGRRSSKGLVLLDAHWAHEVPGMHAAIVLRVRPTVLRRRLKRRRYPAAKIAENLEAEGIGIILSEAAERFSVAKVAELDVTGLTAAQIVRRLMPFLRVQDSRLTNLEIGRVDWTADFLEWSLTATAGSSTRY
jgi:adenylate kinase